MAVTLAAIGDSWGRNIIGTPETGFYVWKNNTDYKIYHLTKRNENHIFFLALWEFLNDKRTDFNSLSGKRYLDYNEMYNYLSIAPCTGPYFFKKYMGFGEQTNSCTFWGGRQKFRDSSFDDYADCNDVYLKPNDNWSRSPLDHGSFAGLDYMLLYNLYRILKYKENQGNTDGRNAKTQIEYVNHKTRIIDNSFPYRKTNVTFGTNENSNGKFISFGEIYSHAVINPNHANLGQGRVRFEAKRQIKLVSGFNAKRGSFFNARISDNYNCNYKTISSISDSSVRASINLVDRSYDKDSIIDDLKNILLQLNLEISKKNIDSLENYLYKMDELNFYFKQSVFNNKSDSIIKKYNSFSLQPNPSSGKINIVIKGLIGNVAIIKITNNYGLVVHKEIINMDNELSYEKILDLSAFENGFYTCFVISKNIFLSKKFMIIK